MTRCLPHNATAPPPSRHSNPFATCWTRPGALPWRAGPTDTPERVVQKLLLADWRGQVVGPHGSGKSTLLRALVEPIRQAGKRPLLVDANRADVADDDTVLLVEAFERLAPNLQRDRLRAWRRASVGFVVTAHRTLRGWRGKLPVVALPKADTTVVATLFALLTQHRQTPVTLEDAFASFASRDGNLRDVWFDLYDLHERRSRPDRTTTPVRSYLEWSARVTPCVAPSPSLENDSGSVS